MNNKLFCAFFLIFATSVLLSGCGVSDSETNEYSKWTFSGYVVDGVDNKGLSGAKITYQNGDGDMKSVSTDGTGAFYIENLAYGAQSFRFSYFRVTDSDGSEDTLYYGERVLNVSSTGESSAMEGIVANGARVVRLYPLNASLKGDVYLVLDDSELKVPAESVLVSLQYLDTTFVNNAPESFLAVTDSLGRYSFSGLPADSNWKITFSAKSYGGLRYVANPGTLPRLQSGYAQDAGRTFMAKDSSVKNPSFVVSSNVLDVDGLGLKNISPLAVPYFVMKKALDPENLSVSLTYGDSAFLVNPKVAGDTVFLRHDKNFPANKLFTADIYGYTLSGKERVHILLDSTARFETGAGLHIVSSNTWQTSGKYVSSFAMYDTLWIRFSDSLNTDLSKVAFSEASKGQGSLYVRGALANASAWIHGDTLFVRPDQRLDASAGDSVGLNVTVYSKNGLVLENAEIYSKYEPDAYTVKWTNTLSTAGKMREDLKPLDTVYIVSSLPVASVIGFSALDTSTSLPTGIQRGDISLHGDTIVFAPSVSLAPNVLYGLDFDIKTPSGNVLYNALGVKWKTKYQVNVLSVNNRTGAAYRVFKAVGDSLVVTFSEAINTSASAPVPFKVNMTDVKSNAVQTAVTWNSSKTVATIRNVNPLPTANFGAAPGNSDASSALAVSSVTFDLTAASGETARGLTFSSGAILIYTEEGICPVNSNAVKNHSSLYELKSTETPRSDFPLDSALSVTFNRALDTAYMKQTGISKFVILKSAAGDTVTVDYSFSGDAKTLFLKPASALTSGKEYFIRLYKVPAKDIRDAAAIDDLGGIYSGAGTTNSYLLSGGFSGL